MTNELPNWLTGAVAGRPASLPEPEPGEVGPGDLCRVQIPGEQGGSPEGRIVLVIDTDRASNLASVVLTHADYDLRTDQDVLVTAEETRLPFALAVETDVVGPVPLTSLSGRRIGRVRIDLSLLREATLSDDPPHELMTRVGVPIRGPKDARWAWKESEGGALGRLIRSLSEPVNAQEAIVELAEWLVMHGPTAHPARREPPSIRHDYRIEGRVVLPHAAERVAELLFDQREDALAVASRQLLTWAEAGRALPLDALVMLAAPGVTTALGVDVVRAIGPLLQVL